MEQEIPDWAWGQPCAGGSCAVAAALRHLQAGLVVGLEYPVVPGNGVCR